MYRPTIRYADIFRDYVNAVFHATHLDRNQIIRCALFTAAQTREFHEILEPYRKKDVSLPSPLWSTDQHGYWLEQCPEIKEEGGDVSSVNDGGETVTHAVATGNGGAGEASEGNKAQPGRIGAIPTERITIKEQGAIVLSFN